MIYLTLWFACLIFQLSVGVGKSRVHNGCNHTPRLGRLGIINGHAASIEDFPFPAVYGTVTRANRHYTNFEYYCGSSIISDRYLLTSAFCTSVKKVYPRVPVVFSNNEFIDKGVLHWVDDEIPHPAYVQSSDGVRENDIALLKIRDSFHGKYEKPIGIAPPTFDYIGLEATMLGWGATVPGNTTTYSSVLRKASTELLDTSFCDVKLNTRIPSDTMICAYKENVSFCLGDFGGPLVYKNMLLGVLSWYWDCRDNTNVGISTRVAHYQQWIDDKLYEPDNYQ